MMYLHPDDGGAVVNTGNQQDQNTKAYCKITRYESKPRGALAVTDMTDAYKDYAKSAVRGVPVSYTHLDVYKRQVPNGGGE